ncbi:MAG: hypothetical protein H7296_12760 [Bacteroidia bacterium]|nr:hypothetical protein [Bacteroidia bacterium]
MNDIKPVIFLVPVLSFIIIGVMFYILHKKASDKKAFSSYVLHIIVFAFILNLAWELIQLPFYNKSLYDVRHISFCALASVADIIMVLLIYFSLNFIFSGSNWIQHLTWHRMVLIIFIGGTGAILSELRHIYMGSWTYASSMPLIPYVKVGLFPVLQFLILPLLIYFLSFYYPKINRRIINKIA